ncbi:hypothetical protein SDC9_212042 [bioreactor metagenome]|uniref:Uncharacterized protein n=1 Tax=bioreactor metagenome TaxID=1076179 RepID=A0A645JL08_9ZZZZ
MHRFLQHVVAQRQLFVQFGQPFILQVAGAPLRIRQRLPQRRCSSLHRLVDLLTHTAHLFGKLTPQHLVLFTVLAAQRPGSRRCGHCTD